MCHSVVFIAATWQLVRWSCRSRPSIRFSSKYRESPSRETPEFFGTLRSEVLADRCPLRGSPRCPPASNRYRTSDGTCNNFKHPWRGSSMTPMQRFLPPMYEDGVQSPRLSVFGDALPSPREISVKIHSDRDRPMSSVTLMFMQWGQFLDHDVTSTAQSRAFNGTVPMCCLPGGRGFLPSEFTHPECLPIRVSSDDWFLSRFGIRCMEFVRSAPSTRINCDLGWREQLNQVTSYIDGSMIYGSDVQKAESLRTFRNGRLQYGRGRRRLQDPEEGDVCRRGAVSTSCFGGGDGRFGEQPALTALHTIWLRYHNKLAGGLQDLNSHWSDEKVYQEARRIVGALIQHVTYREFLPIVLGQDVVDLFQLGLARKGYFNRYDAAANPTPANSFSAAAFRFGHSLVQTSFVRATINHRSLLNNVSIHDEQENPENIWSAGSVDRLILGLCNQPSQRRDEFISEELTNHLFQSAKAPVGMDLAAVNIQRGRDHGVPSYTAWREPCGLNPIKDWIDLRKVMSMESVRRFRSVYQDVDDIDLYTGGLGEKPVRGGVVGPTFACIIAQQFASLRTGDRFWYENGGFESSFTPAQLQHIRRVSLSQVICHTIDEIDTIQPFVFLSGDEFNNAKVSCSDPSIDNFDLFPWAEGEGVRLNDAFDRFENFDENDITIDDRFGGFDDTKSTQGIVFDLFRESRNVRDDKIDRHEMTYGDLITDETTTNETMTNETMTNETMTNETITNETMTNETMTNETMTNETISNETMTNETMTNETMTNKTMTNETMRNETMTNKIMNDAMTNTTRIFNFAISENLDFSIDATHLKTPIFDYYNSISNQQFTKDVRLDPDDQRDFQQDVNDDATLQNSTTKPTKNAEPPNPDRDIKPYQTTHETNTHHDYFVSIDDYINERRKREQKQTDKSDGSTGLQARPKTTIQRRVHKLIIDKETTHSDTSYRPRRTPLIPNKITPTIELIPLHSNADTDETNFIIHAQTNSSHFRYERDYNHDEFYDKIKDELTRRYIGEIFERRPKLIDEQNPRRVRANIPNNDEKLETPQIKLTNTELDGDIFILHKSLLYDDTAPIHKVYDVQTNNDQKPDVQVNIKIQYVLPTTTTPRPHEFHVHKPQNHANTKPIQTTRKPFINHGQIYNKPTYLNQPTFTKPQTSTRPIYVSKPDNTIYHPAGQITVTNPHDFDDVPVFVSKPPGDYYARPNPHRPMQSTTVVDVDYDPIYEDDWTTKRPKPLYPGSFTVQGNFQQKPNFQTIRPTRRPQTTTNILYLTKRTTRRPYITPTKKPKPIFPTYLYLQDTNDDKPVGFKDPIDDAYANVVNPNRKKPYYGQDQYADFTTHLTDATKPNQNEHNFDQYGDFTTHTTNAIKPNRNDHNRPNFDQYDFATFGASKPNAHKQQFQVHHIDDKLDFKSNLLPARIKDSGDKNFVKISSVRGNHLIRLSDKEQYIRPGDLRLENREGGYDGIQPSHVGDSEIIDIDVVPSEVTNENWMIFDETEDATNPTNQTPVPDLNFDVDCATELPKPMNVSRNASHKH